MIILEIPNSIKKFFNIGANGKIPGQFLDVAGGTAIVPVPTKAAMLSANVTAFYLVAADETNSNRETLFFKSSGGILQSLAVGPVPVLPPPAFTIYGAPENESSYTVVNLTGTEADFNTKIGALQPNTWLKFPANGSFAVTGGFNVGRAVSNCVIDLNGSTLTCGTGRVGMMSIYDNVIQGLRITGNGNGGTNGKFVNSATGKGTNGTGYGIMGFYENAEIRPVIQSGNSVIPGIRVDHIEFNNPQLDMDCIFGNTWSTVKDGGNGAHHLHSDLVFEDLVFTNTGSAGLEYLSHAWDDNNNEVWMRNLIFRRNTGTNTGLVSTKTPKFGPLLSFSGQCVSGLVELNNSTNASYAQLEIVGGSFFEIKNNTGVSNDGRTCTGIAMSDKNQTTHDIHIHHNNFSTSGSSSGRGMYAYNAYNLNVHDNTFDTRQGNDFVVSDSEFKNNNWHSTDYSTMRMNNASARNLVRDNTMSNLNATPGTSAVISLSGTGTTGNTVTANTLVRNNNGVTTEQYGGAAGNVITGNFPDIKS